jgi:hypothetical protein
VSAGAYIALYVAVLGCVAVSALKGKYWFALLGLVIPVFAIVGAVCAPKPGSLWAGYLGARVHDADDWQPGERVPSDSTG